VILKWLLVWLFASPAGPPGLLELASAKGIGPHTSDAQSIFLYTFTRGGERRDTLVLTAGSTFQIEVPNPSAQSCVSLLAGMPFNLGDGAILNIYTDTAAEKVKILQRTIDPAHHRPDRDWLPIRFDVPSSSNSILLSIEVDAGSRKDFTGDWVGLAGGRDKQCLLSTSTTRR
jgi:hypothetical protein